MKVITFNKKGHDFELNQNSIQKAEVKFTFFGGRRIQLEANDHEKLSFKPSELRKHIDKSDLKDPEKTNLVKSLNTRGYVDIGNQDSELSKKNFFTRAMSYIRHAGSKGKEHDVPVISIEKPMTFKEFVQKDFDSALEGMNKSLKSEIADEINKKLNMCPSIEVKEGSLILRFEKDLPYGQANFMSENASYDIDSGFEVTVDKNNWQGFQRFIESQY